MNLGFAFLFSIVDARELIGLDIHGCVMAAWEGRGKTGALLSCIWVVIATLSGKQTHSEGQCR